jgi:hypothetical protein
VYLKVSPIRGLCRFKVKGKLSPRFIRPLKILESGRSGIQVGVTTNLQPSEQVPTQTKVEAQLKKEKDLRNLQGTDRPFAWRGRTVCGVRANCLWVGGGPSEIASRISSSAPRKIDCPPQTRRPSDENGLSEPCSRTVRKTSCNQNHPTQQIEQTTRKNT